MMDFVILFLHNLLGIAPGRLQAFRPKWLRAWAPAYVGRRPILQPTSDYRTLRHPISVWETNIWDGASAYAGFRHRGKGAPPGD